MDKTKKLSICLYVWYVHIPYMHCALFVRDAIFHNIHIKRYSKLATFESQEEFVCTTHLWNPKKEGEKG